jgi:hypothetical protein
MGPETLNPPHLVQLVNGGADGAELLGGHPTDVEHGVQQLPVVKLNLQPEKKQKHGQNTTLMSGKNTTSMSGKKTTSTSITTGVLCIRE